MNTRRDLLKLFTAGATVVPVIGKSAIFDAASILIDVPKVALINPGEDNVRTMLQTQIAGPHIDGVFKWVNALSGKQYAYAAKMTSVTVQTHLVDVTRGFNNKTVVASYEASKRYQWTISGELLVNDTGEVMQYIEGFTL